VDLANKKILFYDLGANVDFCAGVGRDFGAAMYYSPWEGFLPDSRDALIGRDMGPLERVDSFFKNIDAVDVIAFTDVGMGDLAAWLREGGYAVWGGGNAEVLELDRWGFLKMLRDVGAPVPETQRIVGMDALTDHLLDPANADRWLKRSYFRNDFETFHHEDYELSRPFLDNLRQKVGPHADEIEVLSQVSCPGREIGYDGPFCIDGRYAQNAVWGYEKKDKGYVGKSCGFGDLPASLREAAEIMAPMLEAMGCRGNFHCEVREGDDGVSYITDPCVRPGSPPIECMTDFITNWPQVVYGGARGEVVEPEFAAAYTAALVMTSPWLKLEKFLPLRVPTKGFKMRRGYMSKSGLYAIPANMHDEWDICGHAVGQGSSPEEAIDAAIAAADEVKGIGVTYDASSKDDLLKLVEEGAEF